MNALSDSSGSQESEMAFAGLKLSCEQGCVSSGVSGGESFLLPFLASRCHLRLLVHGILLCLQNQQHSTSKLSLWFVLSSQLSLTLTLLPPSYTDC